MKTCLAADLTVSGYRHCQMALFMGPATLFIFFCFFMIHSFKYVVAVCITHSGTQELGAI